ncbi:MAG: nucleotidyltransferase domain-containing protein [Nanoarchaeota archaeon]
MTNIKLRSDPLEFSEGYLKVLHWFFSYPTHEIGLNDLSQGLKISKITARKAVNKLEKEGFLKVEDLGRIWRISCNQQHGYNFSKKISYHLGLIANSNVLKLIHGIIPNSKAIILFGSYRKGDDIEKSDIDIAVEIADDKELEIMELGMFEKLGYRKDVKVNLHVFSRNKINLNLFSNIANGIVLEGFLEVRP